MALAMTERQAVTKEMATRYLRATNKQRGLMQDTGIASPNADWTFRISLRWCAASLHLTARREAPAGEAR